MRQLDFVRSVRYLSDETYRELAMQVSQAGRSFIASHEGFVARAYKCPAGVTTIGYGFTNGSRVFLAYWKAKHGRALQMGDTITRSEANNVFQKLLDEDYGKAVTAKLGALPQHQHDAAVSVAYNCGAGALGWKWAQALKAGNAAESARLLRTTAVTANGVKLNGLIKRRSDEARLLETGNYGVNSGAIKTGPAEYQQMLVDLGWNIAVDGKHGPQTDAAVRAFQEQQGLAVDGVVGAATMSALMRALGEKNADTASLGLLVAAAGAGATAFATIDIDWLRVALICGGFVTAGVFAVALRYFLLSRRKASGTRVSVR